MSKKVHTKERENFVILKYFNTIIIKVCEPNSCDFLYQQNIWISLILSIYRLQSENIYTLVLKYVGKCHNFYYIADIITYVNPIQFIRLKRRFPTQAHNIRIKQSQALSFWTFEHVVDWDIFFGRHLLDNAIKKPVLINCKTINK